jgi:hypothetical protein
LARAVGSYLFVTRLPVVSHSSSFVALHRPYRYGYDVDLLNWVVNRGELVSHARTCGLRLVREFLISEHPNIRRAPEQCEFRGFLFAPADASRA